MQDHYFTADPTAPSRPGTVRLHTAERGADGTSIGAGVDLTLATDSGVFSQGRVDRGTKVLLESAPMPGTRGPMLDLGCGYGPIALTLATRRRRLPVWAIDLNDRALGLTRANAESAGLGNVTVCRPDEVPDDVTFAGIYSNPPIRSGKAALHEMLLRWLPRLSPDGVAYLVVSKNLGSDSLARWLDEQGFPTSRLTSDRGFRVLEVRPATS
ncbi:class I SAM-dependent methyltransferase [Pseudonocardia sp. KRD291]|uniref:class I SAM-dependent methyltransferase n=1 Tax=Pseudonocardia sp. KRD291 TaxID=2792007 RepID=UPI001C49EAD2|nr:methyltransferase [Pseudonocardia sp. KRD291]